MNNYYGKKICLCDKVAVGLAVLMMSAFFLSYLIIPSYLDKFNLLFNKEIRGNAFAGFLALAGFLLSLETFIIINMKEKVFDNKNYQRRWLVVSVTTKESLYFRLSNLSDILNKGIFWSLTTSITQLTIGLFATIYSTAICSTFLLLAYGTYFMQ